MKIRGACPIVMLIGLIQVGWLMLIPSQGAQKDEILSKIGPAPAFTLTTQDGKRLSLKELGGKVVAITFIYTGCVDTCPLLTAKMARVQDGLGSYFGPKVFFISITVDPERDTPAVLKDYLASFDPHLRALTGEPAAVDAALKAYRVYAKKVPLKDGDYTMDHTAAVYLMDKNGRFVAPFNMKRTAEAEAADVRGYL